ncbi:MAG: AAA family ATPase [Candidatus Nanohaloarchaeota archaeon QJJ-5]|nr:AAA family ATPase [Candidatus Nanohaloarchaeota archaeon QJJ-5]
MSDDTPRLKRHLLDDDFDEQELNRLENAIKQSEKLQKSLRMYNKAVEDSDDDRDDEFYKQRIQQMKSSIERKEKSQGNMARVVSPNDVSKQQASSSSKQTPALRGVVTGEFDGSRIWVEPKSAPKGEYGVDLPQGLSADDLSVGTEVALNPQNFSILDVLRKRKDPDFDPVSTDKTFGDVGGLDEVIATLRRNVGIQLDTDRREIVKEWGLDLDKSLMLVGPPGTGKTLLVKALANEYDADMFMVNGPQLVEKFIGEGAKKIKRLYDQARSGDRPAIVFIDEIDSIAKKRQENRRHGGEEVERTMSQLLSELDGLDQASEGQHVISIFATNKPSIIDPAIVNRCSAVEVDVPGPEAKEEILQVHTRQFDLADDVDFGALVEEMPETYTGRDIEQICKQAAITAVYADQSLEDIVVRMDDFREALQDLKDGNIGMEKDFLGSEEIHEEIFA